MEGQLSPRIHDAGELGGARHSAGPHCYVDLGDQLLLVGALALFANWPLTIFLIMPSNNALMATAPDDASAETRRLIERWGRLHAVRSVLGALATIIFLWALH